MQISVVDMDPAITELVIDIDGQVLRYAHGPDRPLKVTGRDRATARWRKSPPARVFARHLNATDRRAVGAVSSAGRRNGTGNGGAGRQLVEYDFDGRRVVLEITAGRDFNPVSRELLQNFSCPARAL